MKDIEEITNDHLFYKIVNQTGDKEWTNGIYFDESIVTFFVSHVSSELAVKIGLYIKNLNCELRITKQTFTRENEELKERLKKSNEVFNHERAGTIVIIPTKVKDIYRLKFSTKTKSAQDNETVINNIHNIDKMELAIYYYSHTYSLSYIEPIYGHKNQYKITDLDQFCQMVDNIKEFVPVSNFDLQDYMDRLIMRKYYAVIGFSAKVFEVFCSIKYGINLYGFELTESVSLNKRDTGADLFDIDEKKIGQCKYYKGSTITLKSIDGFIDFCNEFTDFKCFLFVNEDARINDNVIQLGKNNLFEIVRVNEKEFLEFQEPYLKAYNDRLRKIEENKGIINTEEDFTNEEIEQMTVKFNELMSSNDWVRMMDVVSELKVICPKMINASHFRRLFADRCENKREDDTGRYLIRLRHAERSDEEKFIREYIGIKQYIISDYVAIHNQHFGTNYSTKEFISRFGKLFRYNVNDSGKSKKILKSKVNGKQVSLLELVDFPNREELYREFIRANIDFLPTNGLARRRQHMAQLLKKFNEHFHHRMYIERFWPFMAKLGFEEYTVNKH